MLIIKDIIAGDFLKVSLFENVRSASKKIKKAPKGVLLVFDKDKFCGIVTPDELSGQNLNRLLADLSVKKVAPISISLSIEKAYQSFKKINLDILPVINDKGDIIGILSKDDLWASIINELKITNQALEKGRFELEVLNSLGRELTGISDLGEAMDIINKYLWEVFDYSVASFLVFKPLEERFEYRAYLKESVSEDFLGSNRKKLIKFMSSTAESRVTEVAAEEEVAVVELQSFGVEVDNKSNAESVSDFIAPLSISDKITGAILIASSKPNLYQKEEEQALVKSMMITTSVSIERLYTSAEFQYTRTEDLVKSLSNGIAMFDVAKKVILVNPAAAQFLGIPKDAFSLRGIFKLFPDIKLGEMIDKVLKSGKIIYIEEAEFEKFVFEIFIIPIKDFKRNISGGAFIFHDITHVKEVERMKTEFVSVASHQLRTPLTAIKLFVEMLDSEEVGKLNTSQKEYMDNVQQSTERMIKLVNDLLNVARLEGGRLRIEPKPIQLEDFIQGIINDIAPLAGEHKCRITFRKPKTRLPKIPIDSSLMRQVIHNLVVNAIQYSPKGQCDIVVSLLISDIDKSKVLISVKDKGMGIPQQAQERIFEKFFRADNAVKLITGGTGLGLYVSKMITEASGGKIWFESQPKKGTTFYITIPTKGMPKKAGEKGLAA